MTNGALQPMVDVCDYDRVRYGNLEHVRRHKRRFPQRRKPGSGSRKTRG